MYKHGENMNNTKLREGKTNKTQTNGLKFTLHFCDPIGTHI